MPLTVSWMAYSTLEWLPLTSTSTESEVDDTAATVGAAGTAASVYLTAVLL